MKTLPQQLLDGEGHAFGNIEVAVDVENKCCAYRQTLEAAPKHIVMLDTLDEINGAAATHTHLAGSNAYSANIVAALRFAASQIRDKRWGRT